MTQTRNVSGSAVRTGPTLGGAAFQKLPAEQQIAKLFELRNGILSDLKAHRITPQQVSARASKIPALSDDASNRLWSDPALTQKSVQYARELSQLAPNAVVNRQANGYGTTAKELYLRTAVMDAQVRHSPAEAASYASQLAREFPSSPMAGWAQKIAGADFQ